jgi:hypothetical protein
MSSVSPHHKEVSNEKNDQENKERIAVVEAKHGQQKQQ